MINLSYQINLTGILTSSRKSFKTHLTHLTSYFFSQGTTLKSQFSVINRKHFRIDFSSGLIEIQFGIWCGCQTAIFPQNISSLGWWPKNTWISKLYNPAYTQGTQGYEDKRHRSAVLRAQGLLLCKIQVPFPTHTHAGSQPPVTPATRDLLASQDSCTCEHVHAWEHAQARTHTNLK